MSSFSDLCGIVVLGGIANLALNELKKAPVLVPFPDVPTSRFSTDPELERRVAVLEQQLAERQRFDAQGERIAALLAKLQQFPE